MANNIDDLKTAWHRVSLAASAVRGVPFIVAFLAVAALLLDLSPQGQDLADSTAENPAQVLFLFVTSAMLGIEAWFWTRNIINENCGLERSEWPAGPMLRWTPRILGLSPFLIAAAAVGRFHGLRGIGLGLALVFAGVLLFAALVFRTTWIAKAQDAGGEKLLSASALQRTTKWFEIASFLTAVVLLIVVCLDPVSLPQFIGPISTVFVGFSLIIPVVSRILHWGTSWKAPVLSAVVVYLLIVSTWLDNHGIGRRAFGPADAMPISATGRSELPAAFDRWYAQAPRNPGSGPVPIIFVAAEGGASRAGFWAAENLGLLQEKSRLQGRFASSLFAISSVSGGSVGATAFVSQLYDNPRPKKTEANTTGFAEAIKAISGGDFLSPVLAGLLFPDLAQRGLPFPLLPDRAEALERAFERGWSDHCAGIDKCDAALWRKPFLSLWAGSQPWIPALLINGSRQEDGRRIITSNLVIDPNVFSNSVDFYNIVGHDVPVSSAIHNGARFPLVSPGGTLSGSAGNAGHIIDGGYIDGHGVLTMGQLARAVMAIAKAKDISLQPIFIELNNDSDTDITKSADLVRGSYTETSAALLRRSDTHLFAGDLLGPLDGLYSAGGGNGTTGAVAFSHEIQLASSSAAVASSATPQPSDKPTVTQAALSAQLTAAGTWGTHPTYRLVHLCKVGGRGMAMDWAVSSASRQVSLLASGYSKSAVDPCANRETIHQIERDYEAGGSPPSAATDPTPKRTGDAQRSNPTRSR